ncbi:ScbA/BarX family gamma-butyrolactone biosynthesis protein [Marinomonas sp. TI.3.20]|uniref:ScbA/BarX family gamma-butyrolactone biosynthesis protein n=1 Tax=Marinomonas sp. TI.3.20 TaxID=3121296 RepID=UPI00311D4422
MESQSVICSKLANLQASAFLKELDHIDCSFGNTVSKKLVHRAAVSEVFLTDANKLSDDKFYTGAHLPRTHSYYNDNPSRTHYENIVLLEVCRQSSIIVSHNYYNAPMDAKFIFNEAKFHIVDNDALLIKPTPSSVLTEVDVISKEERNGKLNGLTFEMRLYVDGKLAATKLMDITWLNKAIWNKMRSKALKQAEKFSDITFAHKANLIELSHLVGRTNIENVVLHSIDLKNGKYCAGLRINKAHPAMFDHPLDHVPGMLLIEAFRQMAIYAAKDKYNLKYESIFMAVCDIDFTKFTEFNPTSYCYVDRTSIDDKTGEISIALSVTQQDAVTALCHVKLARK